jgi:hypothetical protein
VKKTLTQCDQKLSLRKTTLKDLAALTVLAGVHGGRDLTRFTGCDAK